MYIDKTSIYRPCVALTIFSTLNVPYKMIETSSIVDLLGESTVLANLPRE